MFLEGNGIATTGISNAQLYDATIAIAEKRLDKAGLAGVFRSSFRPDTSPKRVSRKAGTDEGAWE